MSQPDLDKLTSELEALADEEVRHTELIRSDLPISRDGIRKAEIEAKKIKKRVEAKRAEVERASTEIRQELEAQQRRLREQMTVAQQAVSKAMEPIEKVMRDLNEGLTTMSLYLGRGEQIFTIREGEPADKLEPIIIRQMVLAMDEETGIFAESDGINATNVEEFDAWLLKDEKHVQQIVPEQKCVVALVPRWKERRVGPGEYTKDEEDELTHFLIRNGEQLYRTSVQFKAGERLVPAADEFVKFFQRKTYSFELHDNVEEAIKPNTDEYAKAMEQSDHQSRHYLRIGLILQGLIDRTEIFHPLHPAGINMLSDPSTHSTKVRIITDGEGGLGSGLQTFDEWHKDTNEKLRVGMRIVGTFDGTAFREANVPRKPDRWSKLYRVQPNGAENPPTGVPLVIEDKGTEGYDFRVRYARTQKVYDPKMWVETRPGWGYYGGERVPKVRASCNLSTSDEFILAYDLADSALMERFLGDRRSRRNYKDLWPLMRAVWKAKLEEEREEEPFRKMLAGVLARENKVTVEEAETDIPDLIRWFKLANRYHRSLLIKDGQHAVKLITAEHKRRMKQANRFVDQEVVVKLAKAHPQYLAIVRPRRGGYIVVLPEDEQNIFVAEHVYNGYGEPKEIRRWKIVGSRSERWLMIKQTDRWAEWDRMADAKAHLTGPERDQLVEYIQRRMKKKDLVAITQEGLDGPFTAWLVKPVEFDAHHPFADTSRSYSVCDTIRIDWSRKGTDTPTIREGYANTHHESNDDDMPWVDDNDKRTRLVYTTNDAEDRIADARGARSDRERFIAGAVQVFDSLWENIERDWLARELERAYKKFMRTGHTDDWEAHKKRLKFEFPHQESRYHKDEPVYNAVRLAIELGLIEQGQLFEDMFIAAIENGLTGDMVWIKHASGSSSGKWDESVIPDCPETLIGIRLDLIESPKEPEEDDEPDWDDEEPEDEDNEADEEEGPDIAGKIRETINDALAPEPESEEPVAVIDGMEILDSEDGK